MTIRHSDDGGIREALKRDDGTLACPLCLMPLSPDSRRDWHCDNEQCSAYLDHYTVTR